MPINERLMAAGQWTLSLDPATPFTVRQLLDFFGHVYVFDSPMRAGLSDATMIAAARWGGVVRAHPTPFQLGGANMITWLGDEDGKGPLLETAVPGAGATFSQYLTALVATFPAITVGTVGAVGGTQTLTYGGVTAGLTPITPRQAIDNLCSIFNAEYRVNKDFTIDAASVGALFKITPTAVAYKKSSGRDPSVVGIPVTQLDVLADVEEYTTRILLQDGSTAWTASNSGVLYFRSLGLDTDGTLNAWTADVAAPTITANVVTMPISSRLRAGSTTWKGDGTTADVRMTWRTGAKPMLGICCDNGSNGIFALADGTNFALLKVVGGVVTTVATVARALVNGTSYWMQIVGVGTTYTVAIYSDNAGVRGALLSSTSGVVAAPTTGQITLNNGTWTVVPTGTCDFGGAFTNVLWLVGPTPYFDGRGNAIRFSRAVSQPLTASSAAAMTSTNLLLNAPNLRNEITLSTDEYDIDRDVVAGDWIWVYDVDGGLVDTTNPVRYRGSIIYPAKVRVLAITWPIERGMGVWYRSGLGVWTDLTNYIEWEPAGATFEVGAPVRALTRS